MDSEFSNKVALVTGASGGIGLACARLLASKGASIALKDQADTTSQAQELTRLHGSRTMPLKLDVTDTEGIKDAIEKAISWAGRRDFAVNAAGILPAGAKIDAIGPSTWSRGPHYAGSRNCFTSD